MTQDQKRDGEQSANGLIEEIASMLVHIEANYYREGSGPGSRFEGERLETVQAEAVIRRVRARDMQS